MPKGRAFEIELVGADKVMKVLSGLGDRAPKELGGAMWREGTRIINSAKAITPVDTGTLKGSGHVQMPDISGNSVTVTVGFGGAASNYAIYVHENLNSFHKPPTTAKFLERPLLDAVQGMALRLAQDLKSVFS